MQWTLTDYDLSFANAHSVDKGGYQVWSQSNRGISHGRFHRISMCFMPSMNWFAPNELAHNLEHVLAVHIILCQRLTI